MNNLLENQYVTTTLAVFFVLYGSLAAPKLPMNIANLFTNPFFRMSVIFAIAYVTSKNHSIALIATISLVLLMQISDGDDQVLISEDQEIILETEKHHRHRHRKWHKIMMDEELAKGDNKKSELLRKNVVSEDQIANAVLNKEIDTLELELANEDLGSTIEEQVEQVEQVNQGDIQQEIVNVEEELRKEPNVVQEINGVPIANDKSNLANVDLDNNDTPLETQIIETKIARINNTNIKSTRGLGIEEDPSTCTSCVHRDFSEYKIDTSDIVLPYSDNGFYNFKNM
tara:strand:+ start:572 stop:1426 length:855 start_codon:yes stop_codon:yes gene_type:complete